MGGQGGGDGGPELLGEGGGGGGGGGEDGGSGCGDDAWSHFTKSQVYTARVDMYG